MLYIAFQKGPSGLNPTKGCNLWSANWFATFGRLQPLVCQLVRTRWLSNWFATVGGSVQILTAERAVQQVRNLLVDRVRSGLEVDLVRIIP